MYWPSYLLSRIAHPRRDVPPRRQAGFTLLELLIAIAVFAVVWALALGGLVTVRSAEQEIESRADRLAELQRAFAVIGRDLEQSVARGVRDEYGDDRPAFMGDNTDGGKVILTRAGRQNPAGLTRSTLQRVAYGLQDGALVRSGWRTLDRLPGEEPHRSTLLTEVWHFEMRFTEGGDQWHSEWPPVDASPDSGGRPAAVELIVELEDWGVIRRLYTLPAG